MKLMERNPMIMIIIGVFGISLSAIFVRYSAAPSAVTAAWRLLWTVALMAPVVLGRRETRREMARMGRKDLLLSILSGLFLALHFTLWFESLHHTSVASSTVICCTEVIWVSLGYCLFLGGSLTGKAILAIGITLGGSALVALADSGGSRGHLYGDILSLCSAIAVAAYVFLGRVVRQRVSTSAYTFVVYIACAAALMAFCAVSGSSLTGFGVSAVVVGLLLAVFSTILGHSVFTWCLKYFSPSFVSASKLCEPVVAAALAAVLFSERPGILQLLGGVIILTGVLYYSHIEGKELRQ